MEGHVHYFLCKPWTDTMSTVKSGVQAGWLTCTRIQSPQPLPLCCQFPCTELQAAQTGLHQCVLLVGSLLLCGCLAHPCVAVLRNFLHMVLSVMLHLWLFLSSPAVVPLREISAEDSTSYGLFKFGFSQSPFMTSSR